MGGIIFGTITYISLPWFWWYIVKWNLVPSHVIATVPIIEINAATATIWYENLWHGIILSMAALLGDLWESSLKRQYEVKDSGKLLPGHGGVFDRFDSSLVAIVVYTVILDPTTTT
jgi:CDP-diglyceride synthetase